MGTSIENPVRPAFHYISPWVQFLQVVQKCYLEIGAKNYHSLP